MSHDFPESDWKIFRKVHKNAMERFLDPVLAEVRRRASEPGATTAERYESVCEYLHSERPKVGQIFDDYRRSTALHQLAVMTVRHLVTEEELESFSDDTQAFLASIQAALRTRGG